MIGDLDFVSHIERESARFAAALAGAAPGAPVPSCPDWDADDLLWHVARVQWFWGTIVGQRLGAPPPEEARPERPGNRVELRAFFDRARADLVAALATTPAGEPVWTWAPDRTVGFVRRRQAHEVLIHRVDAELVVGRRGPMDTPLSADGVDEALRVMYGSVPKWAVRTAEGGGRIRLRTADTGATWLVTPGRLSGTDPSDGSSVDEGCLEVVDDPGGPVEATVTGSAADLHCWLWRRPTVAPLERSGDQRLLDRLEAVVEPGIA